MTKALVSYALMAILLTVTGNLLCSHSAHQKRLVDCLYLLFIFGSFDMYLELL